MAVSPARRLFTVDEYYRMAEAGVFGPEERVELLDGEIIELTPPGSRHAACVNLLTNRLAAALAGRAVVSVQNPARLDDLSEPQPDLCVLRMRSDWYREAHPRPDDVLLAIEVADTSLSYDMGRKAPKYAVASIHELWVVDLNGGRINVFRAPTKDRYATEIAVEPGDTITPAAFPDVELDVAEILGWRA